jgi:pimeloyl-ACP methyl ester carboxylesterase
MLRNSGFMVTGVSGGGLHTLATAALLPDRVAAAASVSGAAPYGMDDLDFLAGMGQGNLDEFGAALDGPDALRACMEADRQSIAGVSPTELAAALATGLPPVDAAQVTGELAEDLTEQFTRGLEPGIAGWFDDDIAFLSPWGFDLAALAGVPVAIWHGGQDLFVPPAHGAWLASHIPGATAHLMPEHGHLSIVTAQSAGSSTTCSRTGDQTRAP